MKTYILFIFLENFVGDILDMNSYKIVEKRELKCKYYGILFLFFIFKINIDDYKKFYFMYII